MKVVSISLLFFLVLYSCLTEQRSTRKTSFDYNDEVLTLAINFQDYNLRGIFRNQSDFDSISKNILMVSREIRSDSIDLKFAIHEWTNFGGDFPKSIVTVSSGSEFLYAFPFYDEYYFNSLKDSSENYCSKFWRNRMGLEDHLEMILRKLRQGTRVNKAATNELISMVAGSILNLHEYDLNDSIGFHKKISGEFDNPGNFKECQEASSTMTRLLGLTSKPDVRVFEAKNGRFGYWVFRIINVQGEHMIQVTFENRKCFRVITI